MKWDEAARLLLVVWLFLFFFPVYLFEYPCACSSLRFQMIARAVDDGGTNAILRLVIYVQRVHSRIRHLEKRGPKVTESVHSSLNRKKENTVGIFNNQKEILWIVFSLAHFSLSPAIDGIFFACVNTQPYRVYVFISIFVLCLVINMPKKKKKKRVEKKREIIWPASRQK